MRILFFNYEYPPLGGGGANANAYLFREFAEQTDLTIDCITSAWGDVDEEVAMAGNITLHRLAVGKKERHFWTQKEVLTYLMRAHSKAGELMNNHSYDLCHAFFGFPSGMPAWLRQRRMPYLVSLRGSDVPGFNPRFALQYVLLKPLFRRIWRQARFVVANSVGLRTLAQGFEPCVPMEVIPNGIDTEEFFPAAKSASPTRQLLCVSRMVGRKGVQHLIDAMPAVLASFPEATLTLVGEGDLLEVLKQRCIELQIADRVRFAGYVPHEELPALYRKADLFVLPSFYEGMSNTVLEAMSCGLPVLATGEGGREELFRGNALTVPYGDAQRLAAGIIELLQDSGRMLEMGRRSREIALEFSWAAVAGSYLDLYRAMVSAPGNGEG